MIKLIRQEDGKYIEVKKIRNIKPKIKTKTIGYTWNKVKLTWNDSKKIWTISAYDFAAAMGDAMAETIDYDRLETRTFTNDDLTNVIKFLLGQYFDIEVE